MQVVQPDDAGAVLPRAAPPDAAPLPQAARRHDAQEPAAPQARGVAAATTSPTATFQPVLDDTRSRRVEAGARRSGACARPAVQRQGLLRRCSPSARERARRRRRDRARRAALPVPAPRSSRRSWRRYPERRARSSGCRRSRRTWARGASSPTALAAPAAGRAHAHATSGARGRGEPGDRLVQDAPARRRRELRRTARSRAERERGQGGAAWRSRCASRPLGESVTEGVIVALAEAGRRDACARDDVLLELETDKASDGDPAPSAAGVLRIAEARGRDGAGRRRGRAHRATARRGGAPPQPRRRAQPRAAAAAAAAPPRRRRAPAAAPSAASAAAHAARRDVGAAQPGRAPPGRRSTGSTRPPSRRRARAAG